MDNPIPVFWEEIGIEETDEQGREWFGIKSDSGLSWQAYCSDKESTDYFKEKIKRILQEIVEKSGGILLFRASQMPITPVAELKRKQDGT